MSAAIRVDGVPYTYDTEAEAGIYLSTGERWWGTRLKWRPGTAGKWNRVVLEGVHPFDYDAVAEAARLVIERATPFTPPEAHRG